VYIAGGDVVLDSASVATTALVKMGGVGSGLYWSGTNLFAGDTVTELIDWTDSGANDVMTVEGLAGNGNSAIASLFQSGFAPNSNDNVLVTAPSLKNNLFAGGYFYNGSVMYSQGGATAIQITDTTAAAPTPNKFLRVNGGRFQICNSALNACAFTVDDSFNVSAGSYSGENGVFAGTLQVGGGTALATTNQVGTGSLVLASTLPLTGTTGTITGTSLSATCDSGSVSVTGAVVGSPVSVSSTTGVDVGGAFNVRASVTATGTVTVYVCGTGTPSSLAYNVSVK
jgi:hypothetical protein